MAAPAADTNSAILSGALALPLSLINVDAICNKLTANYLPMGADQAIEVTPFTQDSDYLYVPRQFGIDYCRRAGIEIIDQTSPGHPVTFTRINPPRPYQVEFIADLVSATELYYDFIAKAYTGFGKTYCSLAAAAELGTTTLIVVDQDNLKDQWLVALEEHFGMTIENGQVGIIQGQQCDYQGRAVVIAMVHTLSQKRLRPPVYRYFGLVIVDEVHTVGAPTFSQVLRQFSAAYRFGVSATPKRTDGLQKLLDYNLGKVRVVAEKEHDESAAYFRLHHTVYSWYANISPKIGRILTEVAEDGSRNLLLAESAAALYEGGRDVIVLGDRIEQLKQLTAILYYLGVDESDLGLYAGYDPVYRWTKDAKPGRRPAGLITHEQTGRAEFTPISLQLISKKIPKKQLLQAKTTARIFHATYGMCAKGFDEPRLSAGIDATPRSKAEQVHGRILREEKGKKKPIWVTILDENNYRLVFAFGKRISDYQKSNARLYHWNKEGGLIECDVKGTVRKANARVKQLKSMQIREHKDGHNMLVTQASGKQQKRQHANDTVARIQGRKAA